MWRNSVFVDDKSVHFYSSVEAASAGAASAGVSAKEEVLVFLFRPK